MRQRVRGKGPSHIARGGQRQASTATTILIVDTAQPIVNETTQEKSWWIIPHHATALRVYDRDTSMSHSHTAQVRNRTCILCSSLPRALTPWSGLKNHWKFTCTIFLRLASDYLWHSTRLFICIYVFVLIFLTQAYSRLILLTLNNAKHPPLLPPSSINSFSWPALEQFIA